MRLCRDRFEWISRYSIASRYPLFNMTALLEAVYNQEIVCRAMKRHTVVWQPPSLWGVRHHDNTLNIKGYG